MPLHKEHGEARAIKAYLKALSSRRPAVRSHRKA